jgi:galactose-1-phosphate uridylyltransferase
MCNMTKLRSRLIDHAPATRHKRRVYPEYATSLHKRTLGERGSDVTPIAARRRHKFCLRL